MQQQELVKFLYNRVTVGILITLFISTVAAALAFIELSIQGREGWVLAWYALLCLILFARLYLQKQFSIQSHKEYFAQQDWRNRFYLGVIATGIMLGSGAAFLMPYISIKVQIILHSLLLGMAAGAIAYLSTSLRVYITYLVMIMLPVTIWLFTRQTPEGYLLSFLYLFMMLACSLSVRRMNTLINDALYYRFDNETLVDDLQRLLTSVSDSNKALEKISTTDELTGVSNYRAFRVRLEEVWRQYRDLRTAVSLIKLNLDYYHEYNVHYGLEQGDQTLCEVARLLVAEVSQQEHTVARLYGAEFAIILPGVSCEDARLTILRVSHALAEKNIPHEKSKADALLTMSVGLSSQLVQGSSSSHSLLGRADNALKSAKLKGRNRIEIVEG